MPKLSNDQSRLRPTQAKAVTTEYEHVVLGCVPPILEPRVMIASVQ
jgi:hypothetical protein